MAALSDLESWLLIYLATKSTDPAYPQATRRMLLNRAYMELIHELHHSDPSYLTDTATVSATAVTARTYDLPADFSRVVEVRIKTSEGTALTEVRRDELLAAGCSLLAYCLYGPDHEATLETSSGVEAGVDLYLVYNYWPTELSEPGHEPEIPRAFHDLVALKAAEVAFQLGGEQDFPERLKVLLDDRLGQFWFHVGRRSTDPKTLRG